MTGVVKKNFFKPNNINNEKNNSNNTINETVKDEHETSERLNEEEVTMEESFHQRERIIEDTLLTGYLEKIIGFCRENSYSGCVSEIERIYSYLNNKFFTVSVVGQFSTGKSSFINQLIGENLLPVSDLPTTSMITKIVYYNSGSLVHKNDQGKGNRYPLNTKNLEQLSAKFNENNERGTIYIGLPNSWLLDQDMEVIDTPGVGDIKEERMAGVSQVIRSSDCVVVVISALQAFSLTEMALIEEHILLKKIPRVLFLITKLDLVPEEERKTVLDYAKDRLALLKIDFSIFTLQPLKGVDDSDVLVGIKKLKEQLSTWGREKSHKTRKIQTAYLCCIELVDELKRQEEQKFNIYQQDQKQLTEELAKKKEKLAKQSMRWEELRIQMLNRCNNNLEWMNTTINKKREDIMERLEYSLQRSNSPKEWWEIDFPYNLKRELTQLGVSLENGLRHFYSKDIAWLNHIIEKDYQQKILSKEDNIINDDGSYKTQASREIPLTDMKKTRIISRIATGVATVGGYLVLGSFGLAPLGMMVGMGGGILSEVKMSQTIEKQRKTIQQLLRKEVNHQIEEAVSSAQQSMNLAYRDAIQQAEQKEMKWMEEKYKTIQEAISSKSGDKAECSKQKIDWLIALKNNMIAEINTKG